ncbi:flagellar hook-length control protein FliK [Aquibacillus salsiterrae]|uniref:Flagellar hook-length control protein FliK n=1 Tax=Aquibacillus salsiterrae TaxID=2950439 RepID=A0A9X4AE54_9BACI|nr:flagellar hook-length control protein FliK [Aquibacillus salsiterrae]MDC3416392.1 flagellar hook-length control protein FliK [Aquibacillus salsiterrae]
MNGIELMARVVTKPQASFGAKGSSGSFSAMLGQLNDAMPTDLAKTSFDFLTNEPGNEVSNGSSLLNLLLGSSSQSEVIQLFAVDQDGIEIDANQNDEDIDELQQAFQSLWQELKQILSKVLDGEQRKQAPIVLKNEKKLLQLLEQWTKLEKKIRPMEVNKTTASNSSKEMVLFNKLLANYEKRIQIRDQSTYRLNSEVSPTEIGKWLNNALTKIQDDKDTFKTASVQLSSMPISKLEQFVIHVNQSSNANTETNVETEIVEKIQQILKSSNFLVNKNGLQQLTIKLNPDYLGDIVLKFSQINGEMVVKMTVTSQSVKDLLDANSSQLRHMFAPNQVVVEKQEAPSFLHDQYQGRREGQQGQTFNQRDSNQSHDRSNQKEDSTSPNDTFQLLMNEKV